VDLVPHGAQARFRVERLADRLGFAFHGSLGEPTRVGLGQRIGELRVRDAP
jgi:hypothetical protein